MNYKIVGIAVAKSATLYPQRDGGKSVACVSAAVPVGDVTLDVTVYARMTLDGKLSFDVALPRKGVSIAPATETAIKDTAIDTIGSWDGWKSAAGRAVELLNAPPQAKSKSGKSLTFDIPTVVVPADPGAATGGKSLKA